MPEEIDDLVVKVRGDASGGVRALEETAAASEDMEHRVSKSTKKAGDSVDGTTKKIKGLGEESKKTSKSVASDFEKLTGSSKTAAAAFERNFARSRTVGEAFDRTIRDVTARSKTLADLYNKTGQTKFLKSLQEARKDLEKLKTASKDLSTTLAKDVTQGASSASSSLASMGPVIGSLAAALAPLIGGAVSGAALGGVGLGGLAAGIVGQLHSPMVAGAVDQFGADMKSRFTEATSAFAPELEATLGALDKGMGPFWASMKAGFTQLAPYLKVFGDGFARFMNEMGPGIEAAFKGAGPVLAIIAKMLPVVGQGLTIFFQQLEHGSTGAAESIAYVMQAIATAIAETGYVLRGLSNAVDWITSALIKVFDVLRKIPGPIGDKFGEAADGLRNLQTAAATATTGMAGLSGSVDTTNDSIQHQYDVLKTLVDEWSTATDAALSYDNAQLRYIESSQALSKSIKDNGRDWDMTHTKGQNNWHALLNNIQAAKDLYDSDVKLHGVTRDNTDAYQKAIDKLLAQAKAAGLSKTQIDLLRQQYENLGKTLDALNGRKVVFTIQGNVTGAIPGGRASIASVLANSGVHTFANSGVAGAVPHFDMTGTYAGRPGGIYRFAESSTGIEALIAKTGDKGRALSTLRQAAGWHDAVVVDNSVSSTYNHATAVAASGRGGGDGGSTMLYATIVMDSKPVARALVPTVQRMNTRSATSVYG